MNWRRTTMISVKSKFVGDFIKINFSDILKCKTTYKQPKKSPLSGKEKEFLKKIKGERKRLIKMTKKDMEDFVNIDMKNDPVYSVYWEAYDLYNLQKPPKTKTNFYKPKEKEKYM